MFDELRRGFSIRVIAIGRRLFANTPVQRWRVTTLILNRVFRFGYGSGDLDLQFRGLRVFAPADDVTLVPGIAGGFYEQIELDIFTIVAARSSTIADVGGNIGLFACLAAAQRTDSRVVSFEPVPSNLSYLRRNIDANGLAGKIEVVEQAVSDEIGSAPIYIADSIGTHSLASANAASDHHIDVSVTTLDEWFGEQTIDLLKIDVEGFDGHVVRGARRTLARDKPTLFVEYTPQSLAAAGFDPGEMVATIFGLYDEVFLIDEPRHTIARTNETELLSFAGRTGNWNLIAVANPAHRELIQSTLVAQSRFKANARLGSIGPAAERHDITTPRQIPAEYTAANGGTSTPNSQDSRSGRP
jgi:FkbM family methyltransferase